MTAMEHTGEGAVVKPALMFGRDEPEAFIEVLVDVGRAADSVGAEMQALASSMRSSFEQVGAAFDDLIWSLSTRAQRRRAAASYIRAAIYARRHGLPEPRI